MKKFFTLFLLMLLPLMVSALEIDGVYYTLYKLDLNGNVNTAEVTCNPDYSVRYSGDIKILESVTYGGVTYPVTSIGSSAFLGCKDLTSITIPNSVTSIRESAFSGCSGLTSISIPNSVTSIGRDAFNGCTGLSSVVIPNGVTSIGRNAFDDCINLTSVSIPNSVTSIGYAAFSDCSGLTSITIPSSVKSIGDEAFSYCSGLTSVKVLCSPTSVGNITFNGCPNLKEIIFDCETVTSLCRGLSLIDKITMTDNVTSIGENAFSNCSGLTSITIPNSVTSIGSSAFSNCSGLTSITIPNSVTSIGSEAFSGCKGLTSVAIGNSVTTIGGWSFSDCSALTSITIPNSVISIANGIFSNCSSLTSITIPNSVNSIEFKAFSGCKGLTSVVIPNSVTSIGNYAFDNCSGLTSVTISNSLTSIDKDAFSGCSKLTDINVSVLDFSSFCNNSVVGLIKGIFGKPVTLVDNEGKEIKEFVIPDDVTSISDYAFYNCSGLTSISIPQSVTTIGYYAFNGCSNLTDINVSVLDFSSYCNNSVVGLIKGIFGKPVTLVDNEGKEIKEFVIPDDVTSISDYAFYNCNGLTSVKVLCSPTAVGLFPFEGCSSIKDVTFDCETVSPFFRGLSSIERVTMTEKVTSIENDAFKSCNGLTSIIIPNSVTSIGSNTFLGCKNMVSAVIGSGVTSIGHNAFSNDYSTSPSYLIKTIWLTNTPPSGAKYAQGSVNYVANDKYSFSNAVVYPFLSSCFDVGGVKYVPVSLSDKTCDAIDCLYDENAEHINIDENVTYKGVSLTVNRVNPYTFYNNPYIKEVKVNFNGDIGDYAFSNCSNLGKATISNQGNIGESAFYGCSGLETVTISNRGNIGVSAFLGCSGLLTATISNQGNIGERAFYDCSNMTTAELGKGISSIGQQAFSNCAKLTTVVIPDAVETIGSSVFNNCSALEVVKMGKGVKSLEKSTFSGCTALKDMQIGANVSLIESKAFSNCESLLAIEIPQAVKEIKDNVFDNCTGLIKVIIADSQEELKLGSNGSKPIFSYCPLDSVYIGRNINYNTTNSSGYSPFYRNTSLRAVKIADKETEISENEFYGCTNLQRVIIGDGVTSIGNWAFSGCSSLKFFTFGKDVKTIGQEAFSDCTAVTEITSRALTPPTCGSQALDDINKWDCTLFVPMGYLGSYQSAEQWKEFLFAEERDFGILTTFEPVTIGKSGKASYCGDQSLDFSFSDEVKAYIATGFDKDEGTIWLTRVKDVPAGVPVLIKGEANKTYDVPVTDSENSYYTNMFVGNTSGEKIQIQETDGDLVNYYLSGDGTFKSVNKSANIGNNKCYLQLPGTFEAAATGATQTVKVGSIGKASFAAPVDLDFTNVSGLKAFTATGYDKSTKTIWLTRVMKVQKGEGVLLKGDPNSYEIPSAAVQSSYENMFVGNTSGDEIQVQETSEDGSQTNYYLSGKDGSFVSVNGFAKIGNNKCYLALPTSMVAVSSTRSAEDSYKFEEPEVIKLPIEFKSIGGDDEDGTTSIKEVKSGEVKSDEWFTLQGQRVAKPGKGIYIKNGKVVIVR